MGSLRTGKNLEAVANAEKVIKEFEAEALQREKELRDTNTPSPPKGKVSSEEKDRILESLGPTSDVAAAWWIKGRPLAKMGKTSETRAQYSYARVYDKDWGGFRSPADSAKAWIAQLEGQ